VIGSKKLSRVDCVRIWKPALCFSSSTINDWVASITTAMTVTVQTIIANITIAMPVRKRALRG
jgi:hypothetical protein